MTQINLRKASAVQRELLTEICNLRQDSNFTSKVILDGYRDVDAVIGEARVKFDTNLRKCFSLTDVMYSIRNKIGIKNVESGISTKLTEIAKLKNIIAIHTGKVENVILPREVIEGKLMQLRAHLSKTSDSMYSYIENQGVVTSILSEDEVDTYASNLSKVKKAIRELNEDILMLNVKTVIDLDEVEVSVLEDLKLI